MLMYFVSDYYSDQLCDPCKKQISMEGLFILCPLPRNTETVFELVDVLFNVYPDLISALPLWSTSQDTRICAEILFGIEIEHPAAGRIRTGILTVADTFGPAGGSVTFPLHFGADKFHGRETAAQM